MKKLLLLTILFLTLSCTRNSSDLTGEYKGKIVKKIERNSLRVIIEFEDGTYIKLRSSEFIRVDGHGYQTE